MISHPHKTLFVHIPKCAGQSVETAFLNDLGLKWSERAPLLLRRRSEDEQAPERLAHLTLDDYFTLHYLNEEIALPYYKFSIIREPKSRIVSFYNYLGYSRWMSIERFVLGELPKLNKKTHKMYWFFKPQALYVRTNFNFMSLNDLFRLEDMYSSWPKISQKLRIPTNEMPQKTDPRKTIERLRCQKKPCGSLKKSIFKISNCTKRKYYSVSPFG